MVLSEVVNTQYAFPVGIVLICAILVFVFGFKSAEEPAFDQLTTTYTGDDRKPAGKKRKLKDKKSQSNGHATAVGDNHAEVKTSSNKSAAKSEKSPLKEVSNKSKKQESPTKEKSTGKRKEESTPKQLKEKKQIVEKSPQKATKNVVPKIKGKGKENEVAELKNKKNEKNLANLKKAERKPARIDDGGWKQVLSSKDKKNRKKDEQEPFEIIPEKHVGKIEGSPKKKKTKTVDLVIVPDTIENKEIEEQKESKEEKSKTSEKVKKAKKPADKNVEVPEKNGEESEKKSEKKTETKKENKSEKLGQNKEESEKKVDKSNKKVEKASEEKKVEKPNEKKKKGESDSDVASSGAKEVNEKANIAKKIKVVEKLPVAETKPLDEASPESATKVKKNKNKATPKPEAKVENPGSPKKIPSDSSGNSDSNKKVESVEVATETKIDPSTTVIFDELGDTWKEAKIPKKNKKKVRKDQ